MDTPNHILKGVTEPCPIPYVYVLNIKASVGPLNVKNLVFCNMFFAALEHFQELNGPRNPAGFHTIWRSNLKILKPLNTVVMLQPPKKSLYDVYVLCIYIYMCIRIAIYIYIRIIT